MKMNLKAHREQITKCITNLLYSSIFICQIIIQDKIEWPQIPPPSMQTKFMLPVLICHILPSSTVCNISFSTFKSTDRFFFLFDALENLQKEKSRALEELEELKRELQNRVREFEEKRFYFIWIDLHIGYNSNYPWHRYRLSLIVLLSAIHGDGSDLNRGRTPVE